MIRISGFLLGVALVLAAFLLILEPEGARTPGIRVTTEPMEPIQEHVKAGDSATNTTETAPVESVESAGSDVETLATVAQADRTRGSNTLLPNPGDAEIDRYLFWSPFRSEWAAQGFAKRLAVATRVPVEVIEEGAGQYRVGFSYRDELERRERIDQIESITGLQVDSPHFSPR